MELQKKRQIRIIVFIIMNSFLLIARDVWLISLPKEVFIIIEALFLFVADTDEMIEMLCFLFPLMCGLPANYIMIIAMVLYMVKKRHINGQALLAILVFSLLELFAFSRYKNSDYIELIGYITHISVFFLVLFDKEIDTKQCIKNFIIGTTISLGIILWMSLMNASTNWLYLLSRGWFRIGRYTTEQGIHISLNSNTVSFYSAIAIMLAICMLATTSEKKLLYISCICILVVAALLALSRTWFVVMAAFFLYIYWKNKRSIRSFVVMVCVVVLTLILGFVIVSRIPELYEGLIARFTKQDAVGGEGDRRVEFVFLFLGALFEHPGSIFIGAGAINPNETLELGGSLSMHTSIVQLIVCYGFFGCAIFLLLWGKACIIRYNDGKENYIKKNVQIAAFLGCILYSLTAQIINPYYMMFPYLMVTLALSLQKE